jgi:predicted Zn-dependent protease
MSMLNLGPKSLFAPTEFMSREQCKAVFDRIVSLTKGGGDTHVGILSQATGIATWARNRVHLSSDIRGFQLDITRQIASGYGIVRTNRLDDDALLESVRLAETLADRQPKEVDTFADDQPPPDDPMLKPVIWDDPTFATDGDQRNELAVKMIADSERAGLLTAGEIVIGGRGHASFSTRGNIERYYPETFMECSMTVRDTTGTASGWAGKTHFARSRIDPAAIAATALDKCQRSKNRSAVEPGRYTTILEPQAVADLVSPMMDPRGSIMDRGLAEMGAGPFGISEGKTRIGQQVLDRSLTVRTDPMDPETGFVPFDRVLGDPYRAVDWMNTGVLRDLYYRREFAVMSMHLPQPLALSGAYRISSSLPQVSIDEMVRTTKRGIYVTRLHAVNVVDVKSVLSTGFTRDGLWLIEDGKITKPIKNFRFTTSPLFVMNNLEAVGAPVRVFDQAYARVTIPMKVRDFNFTSLADAV